MPRFFVPKEQLPIITGSDAHQVKNVLRMKPKDKLQLLDGTGTLYNCEILDLAREQIVCRIVDSQQANQETKTKITLAQGLPKGRKMDLIVEKCTELGVDQIIPITTERAIAKEAKLERWQKIAKEAAEQSGRATIPIISPLIIFDEVLKLKNNYDLALMPWELEKDNSLKSILSKVCGLKSIIVLIGPEGGFAQKEVDAAIKSGFQPVSLGPRILRTETAGLAILSMLNYALEQ